MIQNSKILKHLCKQKQETFQGVCVRTGLSCRTLQVVLESQNDCVETPPLTLYEEGNSPHTGNVLFLPWLPITQFYSLEKIHQDVHSRSEHSSACRSYASKKLIFKKMCPGWDGVCVCSRSPYNKQQDAQVNRRLSRIGMFLLESKRTEHKKQ